MPLLRLPPKKLWLYFAAMIISLNMYAQTPCILTDTTFREIIGFRDKKIITLDQMSDASGTAILMANGSPDIYVSYIDRKGNTIWNNHFHLPDVFAVASYGNIEKAADGYYVSCFAYDKQLNYTIVVGKISEAGKGLWFTAVKLDRTVAPHYEQFSLSNLSSLVLTAVKNGVLVAVSDMPGIYLEGTSYINVLGCFKFGSTGNNVWNASFLSDKAMPNVLGVFPDVRPGTFAVSASIQRTTANLEGSFINTRFGPANKDIISVKGYAANLSIRTPNNLTLFFGKRNAFQWQGNNYTMAYRALDIGAASTLWANFDTALQLKNAFIATNTKSIAAAGSNMDNRVTENGKILYSTRYASTQQDSNYNNVTSISSDGKKIKEFKFINSRPAQSWRFGFIGNSYDSMIAVSHTNENDEYKLEYFNIGTGGNLNNEYCATYPSNDVKVEPHQLTEFPFKWDLVRYDLWQSTPLVFIETEEQFERQIQCSKVITCDTVKIAGPTETCGIMPLTYTIHRTPGCAKPLQWLVDSSEAVIATYLTDSSILLLPKVNGTISIIGKFLECDNIRDTIKLVVAASSDYIDLGTDTTICTGATLALDAGANFTNYKWQGGESTQSITINEAGKYWVQAEGSCGQFLSDTIIVLQDNISVQAPGSSAVCKGDSIAISPLATGSIANVLWRPVVGINNPRLLDVIIKMTDDIQYVVNVTSVNNCPASDSIQIKAWTLPKKFLLPEYAVCLADSITIRPLKFYRDYYWSDGTNGSSFTTSVLGNYWLKVKDDNNCEATTSFTVKEMACQNTIYAPSAFSPNGDGLNDWFNPIVIGNLHSIYFSIYNRWGQLVFESNNTGGWDGGFKGKQQPAGLYIWQCNYQFAGREKKNISGNVMLLR